MSVADVTGIDPASWRVRSLQRLDEPLSDLGAASVSGRTYLAGGFTGAQFATAVLRIGPGNRTTVVARLPAGLRYAGVASLGGRLYVAGGLTPSGPSAAIYRVDVRNGRVERIGSLPHPVTHAPLVGARGHLWLIGGDRSRDVLRIDPRSGFVAPFARFPQDLANAAATALPDGHVIVVGGDGSNVVWSIGR